MLKIEEIDNYDDIEGLAALIDACDFVVTVSNTTAHIAGAIGKETYLMLPRGKGKLWYWSKEHNQSLWYKSIRIIEQKQIGQWNDVVEEILITFSENFTQIKKKNKLSLINENIPNDLVKNLYSLFHNKAYYQVITEALKLKRFIQTVLV